MIQFRFSNAYTDVLDHFAITKSFFQLLGVNYLYSNKQNEGSSFKKLSSFLSATDYFELAGFKLMPPGNKNINLK